MAGLNLERLGLAFSSRPDLVAEIQSNADSPARVKLFNNIASYICDLAPTDGPALKRRRVEAADSATTKTNGNALPTRQAQPNETGAAAGATDSLAAAAAETVLLEIKDVSVSIPQRKKYDLVITQNYLYARAANTTAPVPGIVYSWHTIEHVLYLPVPEKAQVQHNYVLMPRGAALASLTAPAKAAPGADASSAQSTPPPPPEPLVFTVPATAPKPGSVTGPSAGLAAAVSDSYRALLHWVIEGQLRSVANRYVSAIVAADPKVFCSATRQPFRPQEKAVHVRAFRGSKDGYLFFLPTGILWAFKKPLLFIPLDRITAVSYTNVLQRTFNIVVEVDIGTGTGEEVEFGMIDQEDYGTISESYVQRHGLQDRSMAEQRKAKRELAENARGEKKEGDGDADGEPVPAGDNADADGLTELQRAEQVLQDEEDEEEEDYDPGSDGDSDGSGSSDEEDEDEDGEGGGDDDGDEDDEDEDDEGDENDKGEAMDAED